MKIASIDIGTNTILLLIAEVTKTINSSLQITPLLQKQHIPRIGKNTDSSKIINKQAFLDCKNILSEYKFLASKFNCDKIIAVGTSALRDAANSEKFVEYQFQNTGIDIKILSGEEEAKSTFFGALVSKTDKNNYLVVDIGGGSTEISFGTLHKLNYFKSIDIGAVRITERYFSDFPVSNESFEAATNFIKDNLKFLNTHNFSNYKTIAVAGTPTTLVKIVNKIEIFNEDQIDNFELDISSITNIISELKNYSLSEIENIPFISKGRSDVILAGCLILKEIMDYLKIEKVTVSTKGLRYGVALLEADKLFSDSLNNF